MQSLHVSINNYHIFFQSEENMKLYLHYLIYFSKNLHEHDDPHFTEEKSIVNETPYLNYAEIAETWLF